MGTAKRRLVAMRLERVLDLAAETGQVARAIIFGSFISYKPEPNDVDIFLVMDDLFDLAALSGEARLLFDHSIAQAYFGASVFWVRRSSCFPNEEEMVSGWGLKRDGTTRGLVEVSKEKS